MRLGQVLVDAVGNALIHSANEARVMVSVGEETGSAVILIADEGPGIPEGETDLILRALRIGVKIKNRDRGKKRAGVHDRAQYHGSTRRLDQRPQPAGRWG